FGAGHGRRRPGAVRQSDPAGRAALRPDRAPARPGAGLAHPGRHRNACRCAMGARVDDLWRARISQHRRHAGRRGGDRRARPGAGKTRVPEARTLHRDALGDDDMSSDRLRSVRRTTVTLIVTALLYEAVARTGYFPPALMPTLPKVWHALVASLLDGSMIAHAASTLYRVLAGLARAVVIGLPLGILMGRWKPIENFFMPLASALMPIPSLAWVPVFILWFGLGNTVAILIVFYAALFPMLLNSWSGV